MTLNITAGSVYPDTYSMDAVYTLIVNTTTSYTVTQYVSIPYTTTTSSFVVNGVTATVQVNTFLTGTQLTSYLTGLAPIGQLLQTAQAAAQFDYLTTYVGTGTVSV